jgi:crotonobetainyl-CoA:carnitine CoA-transferase CaiB-like acyl-CoA transferase
MTETEAINPENPLQGITVIELGQFIAGPMAGQQLADYGARVIKIERPGTGDPFRAYHVQGCVPNYGYNFRAFNRKKESLALDFQKPEGAAVLKRLIQGADVVLENFRPGVLARAGFDYEAMTRLNDRIVYCSISGFDENGPNSQRPAFDTIGQALSGILFLYVDKQEPIMRGPTIADQATALQATGAVMAMLVGRERSGRGGRVDISMIESAIGFIPDVMAAHSDVGMKIDTTSRAAGSQAFVMSCSDDRLLAVQLGGLEKNWVGLLAAVDRSDLSKDPRFLGRSDRVSNWLDLLTELRPVFKRAPRDFWIKRLTVADIPCSEVLEISEVFDGSEVKHSEIFEKREHPLAGAVTMMKRVARINGSRGPQQPFPALLGEHGDKVLEEFGYSPGDVSRLRERGIIG